MVVSSYTPAYKGACFASAYVRTHPFARTTTLLYQKLLVAVISNFDSREKNANLSDNTVQLVRISYSVPTTWTKIQISAEKTLLPFPQRQIHLCTTKIVITSLRSTSYTRERERESILFKAHPPPPSLFACLSFSVCFTLLEYWVAARASSYTFFQLISPIPHLIRHAAKFTIYFEQRHSVELGVVPSIQE